MCNTRKSLSIECVDGDFMDERNNGNLKVLCQVDVHKINFRSGIQEGLAVVDEDFSRDNPPDSNLSSTGLGLLLDSQPGSDPQHRNISKVPLLSDGASPPGKAELFPPAWVHHRMGD